MKAWRLNAQKINKQRALEIAAMGYPITPTARVQKNQSEAVRKLSRSWPRSHWLLDGLLMRAGIIQQHELKGTEVKVNEPTIIGDMVGKVKAAFKTIKNWFAR